MPLNVRKGKLVVQCAPMYRRFGIPKLLPLAEVLSPMATITTSTLRLFVCRHC